MINVDKNPAYIGAVRDLKREKVLPEKCRRLCNRVAFFATEPTEEVRALLGQIAAFGGPRLPHLVITGGDPLRRPDLYELIAYGRSLGITLSVTPAGTRRLSRNVIRRFKEAGVNALGLSLDGSDEARHDTFRGEAGSFYWPVKGAKMARDPLCLYQPRERAG